MQKGGRGIRGREQMKEKDHGQDESDTCECECVCVCAHLCVSEDEM